MPQPDLLLIEDDEAIAELIVWHFAREGFSVRQTPDGEQALVLVEERVPDIVLLDIQLPGIDGFAVAERLARLPAPPAVVLVSTRDEDAYRQRLSETPALGFVNKSDFSGRALAAIVGSRA